MCCRYYIEKTIDTFPLVEEMNRSPLMELFQRKGVKAVSEGDVRPTDVAPVVATSRTGTRTVFPMQWGFSGKPLMINARTETAEVRPLFREAWAGHRCVIPASWYFEWEHLAMPGGRKKLGEKYLIHPRDARITWLCGLYRMEEGLPHFVVLTREPAENLRPIHDRMPFMLPASQVDVWISPASRPEALVDAAQTDIELQKEPKPELAYAQLSFDEEILYATE